MCSLIIQSVYCHQNCTPLAARSISLSCLPSQIMCFYHIIVLINVLILTYFRTFACISLSFVLLRPCSRYLPFLPEHVCCPSSRFSEVLTSFAFCFFFSFFSFFFFSFQIFFYFYCLLLLFFRSFFLLVVLLSSRTRYADTSLA